MHDFGASDWRAGHSDWRQGHGAGYKNKKEKGKRGRIEVFLFQLQEEGAARVAPVRELGS
jgi:hypothetical protein